ncbi:unnamed protein product [Lampetra fluviatilis]
MMMMMISNTTFRETIHLRVHLATPPPPRRLELEMFSKAFVLFPSLSSLRGHPSPRCRGVVESWLAHDDTENPVNLI